MITFMVTVITSVWVDKGLLVAKITFVAAEIPFNVAVITSLVTKITFVVAEKTFCDHC